MNSNEIFDKARSEYANAIALIDEMVEDLKEPFPDFDVKKAYVDFDMILQSVLLATSVSDDYIAKEEVAFIGSITSYGDIIDTIGSIFHMDISWKTFALMDSSLISQALEIAYQTARKSMHDFSYYFGIINLLNSEKNYQNRLVQICIKIGFYFVAIDGKTTSVENDVLKNKLKELFVTEWKNGVDKAIADLGY